MLPNVYRHLQASATVRSLLGARPRLYRHGEAPQNEARPYAVWLVFGTPELTLSETPAVDRCTIQLDVYAKTESEVEATATAVRDQMETITHMTAWRNPARDADTKLFRMSLDFDWWLAREASAPAPSPAPSPPPPPPPAPAPAPSAAIILVHETTGGGASAFVRANPIIGGGLIQPNPVDIETSQGVYDWTNIDARLAAWTALDKLLGIRIAFMPPAAVTTTPIPAFVKAAGAVYITVAPDGNEIPLSWDPIYLTWAKGFVDAVVARYGSNPNIAFIDATLAAETNPYRAGSFGSEVEDELRATADSDGVFYSREMWQATLIDWLQTAGSAAPAGKRLCVLNKGGMPGDVGSILTTIGDAAIGVGWMVGNNSMGQGSNLLPPYTAWSDVVNFYLEQAAVAAGAEALAELTAAFVRLKGDFLGAFPTDAQKASPGEGNYDPDYETALAGALA